MRQLVGRYANDSGTFPPFDKFPHHGMAGNGCTPVFSPECQHNPVHAFAAQRLVYKLKRVIDLPPDGKERPFPIGRMTLKQYHRNALFKASRQYFGVFQYGTLLPILFGEPPGFDELSKELQKMTIESFLCS